MKLSKIYSNLPEYFKPIKFNDGLNVIIGKITKPKDTTQDSHNIGKSLLIDVIDYCLLKKVYKGHFTKNLPEPLNKMDFYLEITLNEGKFLTIKRSIEKNTKICFKKSSENDQDFTQLNKDQWDQFELPVEKAKAFLDGELNLTFITPFPYRTGVSYFLRKQRDYTNVFQVEKFSHGRDIEWKSYIGKILGLTSKIIEDKYNYENELELINKDLKELRDTLPYSDEGLDKLRARIEAEEQRIKTLESQLDKFDFKEKDLKISEEELKNIEDRISYINNEIYNLNNDLNEISKSLEIKMLFKIENVKRIFKEVGIYFKNNTLREYKDLENFNIKLTRDRKNRLKKEKQRIEKVIINQKELLENLNAERVSKLALIRERDSFKKYKKMQAELVKYKTDLQELKNSMKKFEDLKNKMVNLDSVRKKLNEKASELRDEVESGNKTLTHIRSFFRELVEDVLNTGALLYIELNSKDNVEFSAHYTRDDDPKSATSESEGTSYHKFLCIFFDLAVLRYHRNSGFYRFVYHDGILEGLDNRKKLSLIETLRRYTKKYNVQHIFTVIESDLPYYEGNKRFNFYNEEIVRQLTDQGDQGRLFNCPIF